MVSYYNLWQVLFTVNENYVSLCLYTGNITKENVIFVQPFRNTIEVITLTGQTIIDILEFAASQWTDNIDDVFAGFLQVSGTSTVLISYYH